MGDVSKWRKRDRELGREVEEAGMRWDSAVRALERAELAEERTGKLYVALRAAAKARAAL